MNFTKDQRVKPLTKAIADVLSGRKYYDRKHCKIMVNKSIAPPKAGTVISVSSDYVTVVWDNDERYHHIHPLNLKAA